MGDFGGQMAHAHQAAASPTQSGQPQPSLTWKIYCASGLNLFLMAHPRRRDGSGLRRTPALVGPGLHCPSSHRRRLGLRPTPTAASILRPPAEWRQVPRV